jgi:hypothetical protein
MTALVPGETDSGAGDQGGCRYFSGFYSRDRARLSKGKKIADCKSSAYVQSAIG